MKVGYHIYDPTDMSTPRYVGVGSKNRGENHWKEYRYRRVKNRHKDAFYRELDARGLRPAWVVVKEFDQLEEALAWEEAEILRIGRADLGTGPLLNRTNGGSNRGRFLDDQSRENLRKAVWENEEVRQRIREKNKEVHNRPESIERHRKAAQRQMASPEARSRQSKISKAAWASSTIRAKMIAGLQAAGKTQESFQNRSAAQSLSKNRPSQKARAAKEQRRVWASMTLEQKAERAQRIREGMAEARAKKLAAQQTAEC